MPQHWHEFTLTVRPWKDRTRSGQKRPTPKPSKVKVIARSQFDATLEFQKQHPKWTVLEVTRGQTVPPPNF